MMGLNYWHQDAGKNMGRRQTERNSELCKPIERKPGKVNEIPLKLNDTPGSRRREKIPENEKTAAGKVERP